MFTSVYQESVNNQDCLACFNLSVGVNSDLQAIKTYPVGLSLAAVLKTSCCRGVTR